MRARSPQVSCATTAGLAPGTRSTGPCASVPERTATTLATAPRATRAVAAGVSQAACHTSDAHRNSTATTISATTKWTTCGWSAARLGIAPFCVASHYAAKEKARCTWHRAFLIYPRQRPTLPRTYARSTIGGSRLNFRVRNGNGCDPAPMTTGKLGVWGSASAPALAGFGVRARYRPGAGRTDRPRACHSPRSGPKSDPEAAEYSAIR